MVEVTHLKGVSVILLKGPAEVSRQTGTPLAFHFFHIRERERAGISQHVQMCWSVNSGKTDLQYFAVFCSLKNVHKWIFFPK